MSSFLGTRSASSNNIIYLYLIIIGSMDSAYGSSIQPQITSTPVQNEVPTIYSVSSDSKLPGENIILRIPYSKKRW